ncbi:hypothetical protein AVEN_33088-1 [Araneus ventricosus]|uniref:Uncharacterized protein n=1 Tax=Araneus ventricosus TaxID=182803 RepID=A0A4Y2CV36_ARAVE|nr:hypothetical protein AVEN_33088-1 [Araneus ventricosus]
MRDPSSILEELPHAGRGGRTGRDRQPKVPQQALHTGPARWGAAEQEEGSQHHRPEDVRALAFQAQRDKSGRKLVSLTFSYYQWRSMIKIIFSGGEQWGYRCPRRLSS